MHKKIKTQILKIYTFYMDKFKFYNTWHAQPNASKIHKITLALFAFFALISALYVMPFSPFRAKAASNYYVSELGSDTNDGSISRPWRTINYAISKANSGDIINSTGNFSPFTLTKALTVKANGSASISVATGRAVTITAPGTVEGFEFTGNITGIESYGIIRISSSGATFINNNIHDAWGATSSNSPDAIYVDSGVTGVHITNNILSHTGKILTYGEAHISGNTLSYTPWHPTLGFTSLSADGSIQIGDGNSYPSPSGTIVEGNTITYPWGNCSKTFGNGTVYKNNDFQAIKPRSDWGNDQYGQPYGDHQAAIYDENHNGTVLEGNTFRQVVGTHYEIDTDQVANITIINNLFIGPQGYAGSLMLKHRSSYPSSTVKIYNNTFLTRGMYLSGPIGWTAGQVKVKNNIFAGNDYAYLEGSSNVYDHQYNIYKSATEAAGVTLKVGELIGNPLLDDNYHLSPGSPAINAGISPALDNIVPVTDKDGSQRFGATDMGAYEYQVKHYVSPTGSALWSDCTNINTPCSLNTALASYVPGDIIYLRGGTYATRYTFSRSGDAQHRVTFRPYNNELVTFNRGFIVTGSYLDFISGGTYDWNTKSYSNINFKITEGQSGLAASNHGGQVDNRGAYNTYDGWQCVDVTATNAASCFYFRSGNYSTLKNFYMNNIENAGVSTYGGMTGTTITQGEIFHFHASEGAINTYGYQQNYAVDTLVEKVWVHGPNSLVREGGYTVRQGDGMHALGMNTIVRNCIFDIYQEYEETPLNTSETSGPHSDNIMLYANDAYDNVIIENTIIGSWNTEYSFDAFQHQFTVDPATDFVTTALDHHGLSANYILNPAAEGGTPIKFSTDGTLPGGINTTSRFYPINMQSDGKFQLSATNGGTAINFSDSGSGTHSWKKDTGTTHSNGFGIIIGGGAGDHVTLRNNIIMSHPNNIPLSPYRNAAQQPSCGIGDATLTVEWYNNIIWGGGGSTYGGTKKMRNNIFLNKPSSAPGDSDYNVFVGTSKPSGEGAHSFTVADVSSIGFSQYDMSIATQYGIFNNWSLATGSTLIGKGEGGVDIGVLEYQGSGPSCTNNADINKDSHVNISDAAILMAKWGQTVTNDVADINCDGRVNISDAAILMARWGT